MTRRLIAAVTVGALVALPLACGDDDDGGGLSGLGNTSEESSGDTTEDTASDETDETAETDEPATPETGAEDTSTDDTSSDDTSSDDTSSDEGDDSSEEPTGGDLDRWCELNSDLSNDPFEDVDEDSPEEIEAAFDEIESQMDDFVDAAPDQIRDDAETVVGAIRDLRDLLESHDYDLVTVATDPAFEKITSNSDVDAASDRIDEFETANCP